MALALALAVRTISFQGLECNFTYKEEVDNMKRLLLICIVLSSLFPSVSLAQDATGGNSFYEMVFGNPDQRNRARDGKDGASVGSESCDGYGGIIGGINSFFCHMEKDMGITGPGGSTKDFGSVKVRAEIAASSTTINSVTYDYVGSVWICDTGSLNCALTTNFSRAYYIAFSYNNATGVNRGYALTVPGIFDGNTNDALEIVYDIGTSSSPQTIVATAVFVSGSDTFKMRVNGSRTSSGFQLNLSGHNGSTGFRFAMSGAPPSVSGGANYYNMYYEGNGGSGSNGFYSVDNAGLAAPATGNGMCVTAIETGSSTSMTAANSSNCSSYSFAAFSYYALTASGSPNAQGLSAATILGSWQGMAANPTSL